MKKLLITAFCLLHMIAISWWTLPYSFGGMVMANAEQHPLETQLFKWLWFDDRSLTASLLHHFVDITGNQQYWDFFAPHSPKYHQYLSVCDDTISFPEQSKIICKDKPLFTNLNEDFAAFKIFGSYRSREYRLTENLVNLEEPLLLEAFTRFYRSQHISAQLVLHQFELPPELKDFLQAGYRMDKLLWISH